MTSISRPQQKSAMYSPRGFCRVNRIGKSRRKFEPEHASGALQPPPIVDERRMRRVCMTHRGGRGQGVKAQIPVLAAATATAVRSHVLRIVEQVDLARDAVVRELQDI